MDPEVQQQKQSVLKANQNCRPEREINILLLGQIGVGKRTFINAFANYIVNDTLEQAVEDQMQVIIPSSFRFTMPDTCDETIITLGNENKHEKFSNMGESCRQQCQSFVFPIGDRNLRMIDTPGIGDTRGLEQDTKNFQEVLTYIAQYEHLNGVCILFKPNEERLNVLFRFCINELLRHLHVSASENLIFVFTNARSTFFMPGSTRKILQGLLEEHRLEHNVHIPFSKENTFLFDNEPFRYLALRKNGIQFNDDETRSYMKSWDHSVKEYSRLMAHIVRCPLHGIRDTLSLNEAKQLVRKLPRPIAETAKLIEENIQLAKEHTKNMLKNTQIKSQRISGIDKRIRDLQAEQRKIQDVYRKLAAFVHANAMLSVNDDVLGYLRYFIDEEQKKKDEGARNIEFIAGLEKMLTEVTSSIELFEKTLEEQKESGNIRDIIQPEEIFILVGTLYRLPITGQQIREQVNAIKISQQIYSAQRENYVSLPQKAASSKLMLQLKN